MTETTSHGRYELTRRVGSGGMAEVWKARALGPAGFEKTVAIKKILPHLTKDPEFIAMFIDEAKVAASMEHANVVRVYDFGFIGDVEDADYFIAMEYISGQDLETVLRREPTVALPPELVSYIVIEIARGLAHAHGGVGGSGPILHRDVSPSNILVSYDGDAKITDFGVAKVLSELNQTAAGILKGKTGYVSPEQTRFEVLTPASDQFSLATVWCELLTGKRLFDAPSTEERIAKIRGYDPVADPRLPAEARDVLERALANNPADRYEDLTAFATAVARAAPYDRDVAKALLGKTVQDLFRTELDTEARPGKSGPRHLEVTSHISGTPSATMRKRLDAPTVAVPAPSQTRLRWILGAVALLLIASGLVFHNLTTGQPTPGTKNVNAYQHYFEGLEAFENNMAVKAARHFNKAIELDPTFARAHYQLAEALIWRGRNEEARVSLDRASELYAADANVLTDKEVSMLQASRATIDKDIDKALEVLERVNRVYPDDKHVLFRIGDLYFHSVDPKKAPAYFLRVIELDPDMEVAHGHLLWTYVKIDDAKGIRELAPAMLRRLRSREAFEFASTSYIAIRDYDAAREVLVQGAQIHPNSNLGGALMAATYLFEGDLENWAKIETNKHASAFGHQYLQRYDVADELYAAVMESSHIGVQGGRLQAMRALMLAAGPGNEMGARASIAESRKKSPLDAGAYYLLSITLLHLGDLEGAREMAADGRKGDYLSALVQAQDCTDASIAQLERTVPLANFRYQAVHHWWLARCYEKRGRPDDAKKQLQTLLSRPVFDEIYTVYAPLARERLRAIGQGS